MTKAQLSTALKRGLGSAVLQIKNSNSRDEYKETVLWCCLHNTCYDMQSEGNRSMYLYEAIKLFEDKSYFETAIIQKFNKETITDAWVFNQLTDLLCQFAAHGSSNSKAALYQKYDTLLFRLSAMRKWQGDYQFAYESVCMALTSLDGYNSFKKIIGDVGSQIIKTVMPDLFIMDWFYQNSKTKFGKKRIDHYLKTQASHSEGIALFLKGVQRFDHSVRDKQTTPTLQEYLDNQTDPDRQNKSRRYVRLYAKVATDEELRTIANTAISEKNPKIKCDLLSVFRYRAFPLNESIVLALIDSDDEDMRDTAFSMLENIQSQSVHDHMIKLLKAHHSVANAIPVLCRNYQVQDEPLLFEAIKRLPVTQKGEWHDCFSAVEALFSTRKHKPKTAMLAYIYKKTLCSYCRCNVVKTMYRRKVLSAGILQECLYDSYDETRTFALDKISKL